jgi:hypothetical protein
MVKGGELVRAIRTVGNGESLLDPAVKRAVLFVNGCVHLTATVRTRRYAPGVGSSLLLYIPLSVVAYVLFARAGYLSAGTLAASAGLGLLYQVVPLAYFLLRSLASHRTAKAASN